MTVARIKCSIIINVLFCVNVSRHYRQSENKNKVRLCMFLLNYPLHFACSKYQYTYSIFVSTNKHDSPLPQTLSASIWQHCHSPSLADLHVLLNIVSPIEASMVSIAMLYIAAQNMLNLIKRSWITIIMD
jgi:hypothetical protein